MLHGPSAACPRETSASGLGEGVFSFSRSRPSFSEEAPSSGWLRLNEDFQLQPGSEIKDFMYAHLGDTWANFCDRVQHYDSVTDRTMPTVQWGEHIQLIALANAYRRTIRVWISSSDVEWWKEFRPRDPDPGKPPFDIAHEYERHYLSVLPRSTEMHDDSGGVRDDSLDGVRTSVGVGGWRPLGEGEGMHVDSVTDIEGAGDGARSGPLNAGKEL